MIEERAARWFRALTGATCIFAAIIALGAAAAAAQETVVQLTATGYDPAAVTVAAGAPVRFVNTDTEFHSVTHRGGSFNSLIAAGQDWTLVLDTPGTYDYYCVPHPWLVGQIVVE